MAKSSSAQFSTLLVDGVNLLAAKVQGVTAKTESITEPTHGLGDDHEEHTPVGMSKATFTQDGGFFDDAVGGFHEAFKAASNVSRQIVASIGAGFTGGVGAFVVAYEVLVSNGKLHRANATYTVSGDVDEYGVVLQGLTPQTVDWTGAAADNLVASTDGGTGYLQVTDLTATSFAGVIEGSPDNATWTPLVTFVAVIAAPNAQRIAVGGAVPRYLRFKGDLAGVGSVSAFAGFSRNSAP
jgi:hypothetical protein